MTRPHVLAKNGKNLETVLALSLALLVLVVYWQVRDHQFLLWDDHEYVVENPQVRYGISLKNVIWAFTTLYASNWHPLTWISHMLDCDLYGLNPSGHHLNNLLLHLVNTLLLFFLLARTTSCPWKSAFVAAVFAIHPLHVESVAWVSERKDLLSTLFLFLTCHAYVTYTRRPGAGNYGFCLLLFMLGLASKPMVATLPLVLLLLDYWPLSRFSFAPRPWDSRRVRREIACLIREKWPFFLLSALSAAITLYASWSEHSLAQAKALPLIVRAGNGLLSYAGYLFQAFWPHDLAFFYPHPLPGLSPWKVAGSALLLAAISFTAFRARRERPYLFMGWLWFLVTLLPVIGLIQAGSQGMANRYTYVPLVGVSVMAAWGVSEIPQRTRGVRWALALCFGAVILPLALVTNSEIAYWRTGESLFQRAIAVTSGNYTAHYMLGSEWLRKGKLDSAVHHLSEALRIRPEHVPARHTLGMTLAAQGKTDEALAQYWTILRLQPGDAGVHASIGDLHLSQGKTDLAISSYAEALRIDPSLWKVHNNLGVAFQRAGRMGEAILHFEEALKINPGDGKARVNLDAARKRVR
jgi:protein O-mannosyl-transferase